MNSVSKIACEKNGKELPLGIRRCLCMKCIAIGLILVFALFSGACVYQDGYNAHAYPIAASVVDIQQYAISAGDSHTMLIDISGDLWAWGSNQYGQLGTGSFEPQYTPTRVMSNIVSVYSRANNTMAICAEGNLWAWGNNEFGQIGDGATTHRHTPVKIISNVTTVSSGRINVNTMAIRCDGSLWAWGWNNWGQLGDGTTIDRHSPIHVMDDVVTISSSGVHTMAIRADGSLWSWGWMGSPWPDSEYDYYYGLPCDRGNVEVEHRFYPVRIK